MDQWTDQRVDRHTLSRRRKVFIAVAMGWCGWLTHPYTPDYRTTSKFDTEILNGSMRIVGFALNRQSLPLQMLSIRLGKWNNIRIFVQVMHGKQIV